MFDKIIAFSVENKLIVALLTLVLVAAGIFSASRLSIDAVPDITNNQVQIVTSSPSLAAQEVEQFITHPIELKMANLPNTKEIRSISRYGLSIITLVFEEDYPLLDARQLVSEYLQTLTRDIPPQLGVPELMPITTGLGEVYQYTLAVDDAHRNAYSTMELRTIQDWMVKRMLNGIEGVIEVSSFGGHLKQYEIAIDPARLNAVDLTITDVFNAIEGSNENAGGSYIEKGPRAYYVRTEGLIRSVEDMEAIPLKNAKGIPLMVGDLATVKEGFAPRFGAMTKDGQGEAVGGVVMMLKGANAFQVVKNIEQRVESIQDALPEGISIEPYLVRSDLVSRVIKTVRNNLIEGGLIVIFVLVLFLGNWRAGIVVASVIPLSLLFAFSMMNLFGISANLMSLGAVDFGIVVDGSVIIVEAILHRFKNQFPGERLSRATFNEHLIKAAQSIRNSAAFGEIIILIVYLPILVLAGIEGKTFKPMAQTVAFAILGAFILSMTYVPMMSSLLLSRTIEHKKNFADRWVGALRSAYQPLLASTLQHKTGVLVGAVLLFVASMGLFSTLGSVFIPTLGEGDLAVQLTIPPGGNLQQSIATTQKVEATLLREFPEVKHVVSKIGTAEVPTDPMAMENSDIMIIMKPKSEWVSADNREEMSGKMKVALQHIPGAIFEFTQPIQLRFNELLTGSKSDLAVKIYGDDLNTLSQLGEQAEKLIRELPGAADVKAEQLSGLPQLMVRVNRSKLAQYATSVATVNEAITTAFSGKKVSTIYEGEQWFDFVVRLDEPVKIDPTVFDQLYVRNTNGVRIPLSQVASIEMDKGPMQISREETKRRITIGVNIRERDVTSLVADIDETLNRELQLPPGYTLDYGGDFENLQSAVDRLLIAVPIALALIFILLYFAFNSIVQATMIFTAIPLAAIGGIAALWLRDMPFSISAGIGFIALFGVAVLNGIVLIAEYNRLKKAGMQTLSERILKGSYNRLRPVLLTAMVAAFGFLPMAISTSDGAEVQQPLATVVIGGLVTSSLLTLLVLPCLYAWVEQLSLKWGKSSVAFVLLFTVGSVSTLNAQEPLELDSALQRASEQNFQVQLARMNVKQREALKSGSWQLGSTQVNWQRGQINTTAIDNNFSIVQNLGNPLADFARVNKAQAELNVANLELQLTAKQVTAAVKSAYIRYQVLKAQENALEQTLEQLNTLDRLALVQLEAGEINATEALLFQREKGTLELQLLEHQQLVKEALIQFNLLLNEPVNRFVPKAALNTHPNLTMSNLIQRENALPVQLEDATLAAMKANEKIAKAQFAPDFSAGYFNQELDRVAGFQGFMISMSIPLWFLPQRAEQRAHAAEWKKQRTKAEYTKTAVKGRIQIILDKIVLSNNRIAYFETTALPQAEQLEQQVEVLLNSGETSLPEVTESLREIHTIKMDYYAALFNLYQYQFELEIYI